MHLKKVKMAGVTIRTPYIPEVELEKQLNLQSCMVLITGSLISLFPRSVRNNPIDRCYICKKTLFTELLSFAGKNGYKYVIDGTNADDTSVYRPGLKSITWNSDIRSPLREAGLTKKEIREMLRKEGLPVADKPAMACLLTRIPYNTLVSEGMLKMIEQAENFLFDEGLSRNKGQDSW